MKKRGFCAVLAALFLLGCRVCASADDGQEQTTSIPVTLTVVHTVRSIDVTLPAALPVSVLDGTVLTADNLRIENHSSSMGVRVSGISVTNGSYTVDSYSEFAEGGGNRIALWINGCETTGEGAVAITDAAFPSLSPRGTMPVRYNAKVSVSEDVSGVRAANVIFTLKAEI